MLHPDQIRDIKKAEPGLSDAGSGAEFGFFESAVERSFRTLGDGREVFLAPFRIPRRGYVVETWEQRSALRRRVKARIGWTTVIAFVAALGFGRQIAELDLLDFALLLFFAWVPEWLVTWGVVWPIARGMESVELPRSPLSGVQAAGQTLHPAFLALSAILLGALAGVGFWIYFKLGDAKGLLAGLLFLWVFLHGIGALWFGWVARRTPR